MTKRYRIAIITRSFPPKSGGIASAHYNLFQLLRNDHDVRAFAFDDGDASTEQATLRKSGKIAAALCQAFFAFQVRRVDRKADPHYCRSLASVIPASFALGAPLRRFRPDIVIVPDNYVPALAMPMPPDASVIWMSRNNYRRFADQPLVASRHWFDVHLAHRMELRALRKAHHVVCPSHYMKRVFSETYPVDLPIKVIYNFMDPTNLEQVRPSNLRTEMGLSGDVRLIYLPSAGTAIKGKRYVYEIIRRLSNENHAAFYISGPIERDLQRELDHLDSSIKVFAPGHLNYQENLKHVAACDFAISPTLIENLSNAIVEGLLLGLPFITFDTGGNREIVHTGVNGAVVPYLDVEGLVHHAQEYLNNPEQLAKAKAKTREPIADLVCPDRIRQQYATLFDSLRTPEGSRDLRAEIIPNG